MMEKSRFSTLFRNLNGYPVNDFFYLIMDQFFTTYRKSFKDVEFLETSVTKKQFIINKIIQADSSRLSEYVKPNSVALTITSPPYRNAIDYSQHVKNLKKSKNVWIRGKGTQTTESYMKLME